MAIKDKLQIILITYNRAHYLSETLAALFSETSPIKDFDITILDNHSTDETPTLVRDYQGKHCNLKYICHKRNIGGNANIARAFEIAQKDYLWILCDDDEYDWSAWGEVEKAIENNNKVICVADCYIPNDSRGSTAYLIHQMTFLPSNIFATSLLSSESIRNIYDSTVFMLPHIVPIVMHINQGGKIFLTKKPLVQFGRHEVDNSYIRGYTGHEIFNRARTMTLLVGFSNMVSNLNDRNLAHECFMTFIYGNHQHKIGTYRFLSDIFLHLNGHQNDMHITDLTMQAPFLLRIGIRFVHMLSNTFLYPLLTKSIVYRILRNLYDKCQK